MPNIKDFYDYKNTNGSDNDNKSSGGGFGFLAFLFDRLLFR